MWRPEGTARSKWEVRRSQPSSTPIYAQYNKGGSLYTRKVSIRVELSLRGSKFYSDIFLALYGLQQTTTVSSQ